MIILIYNQNQISSFYKYRRSSSTSFGTGARVGAGLSLIMVPGFVIYRSMHILSYNHSLNRSASLGYNFAALDSISSSEKPRGNISRIWVSQKSYYSTLVSRSSASRTTLLPINNIGYIIKRTMKKIAVKTFNLDTKKRIALYTQEVIKSNFEEPISDTINVLKNNIAYFNDDTLGETILKQSLVKGLFPRLSYKRGAIIQEMKLSIGKKIQVEMENEKTDFRFIGEILTANRLAESSNIIKEIIMNFENPNRVKISSNVGNVNKDITVKLQYDHYTYNFEGDIKAGNNAVNPFSGLIASVPYKIISLEPYCVINDKTVDLRAIQEIRLTQFREIGKTSSAVRDISKQIGYLKDLPIDDIKKNILIQEEMFKAISSGISIGNPSFYAAYIVPHSSRLHDNFFNKIESKINPNMFDDRTNFNKFIIQALIAYNDAISEIVNNVKQNKTLLKESGLNQIADGLFN